MLEVASGASIVIGRDPLAAVTFAPGTDRMVSRRHARVACIGTDGDVWRLEDLGSRNGVFVNGARVEGVVPLQSGDEVMLGAGARCCAWADDDEPSRQRAYTRSVPRKPRAA